MDAAVERDVREINTIVKAALREPESGISMMKTEYTEDKKLQLDFTVGV